MLELWREDRSEEEMICWHEGERRVEVMVAVADILDDLCGREKTDEKLKCGEIRKEARIAGVLYLSLFQRYRVNGTVTIRG